MSDLHDAIILATTLHKGQVDKAGEPYILHPLRVMLHMNTNEERIVAMLHDTLEDCDITLTDLRSRGFSDEVLEALEFLTKRPEEEHDYDAFISRVASGPRLAILVKMADLFDNKDLTRIKNPAEKDRLRVEKYHKAFTRLKVVLFDRDVSCV